MTILLNDMNYIYMYMYIFIYTFDKLYVCIICIYEFELLNDLGKKKEKIEN